MVWGNTSGKRSIHLPPHPISPGLGCYISDSYQKHVWFSCSTWHLPCLITSQTAWYNSKNHLLPPLSQSLSKKRLSGNVPQAFHFSLASLSPLSCVIWPKNSSWPRPRSFSWPDLRKIWGLSIFFFFFSPLFYSPSHSQSTCCLGQKQHLHLMASYTLFPLFLHFFKPPVGSSASHSFPLSDLSPVPSRINT